MFYGRSEELDRLRESAQETFVIAGSGRTGKTSLVLQYRRDLIRRRDSRLHTTFYVDFYSCSDYSADALAKYIALRIDGSRRAAGIRIDDLPRFIRAQSSHLGGRLDLLFDEVDRVCQVLPVMEALSSASRAGHCRLVLCGKGTLLRTVLSEASPFGLRTQLMRLQPLDEQSASALLLDGLTDLGFRVCEPNVFTSRIFDLTGRMPHLLQFWAHQIVEAALQADTRTLSATNIDSLLAGHAMVQYAVSPLLDIDKPLNRLLAVEILRNRISSVSVHVLIELAARNGISLSARAALDACNDLLVHGVLLWDRGGFRLANTALGLAAERLGLLTPMLQESHKQLRMAVEGKDQ